MIISLVPYTARHTVGAIVPGREIQVSYVHLNFSSRYAMLIAISGTNYYIPTEQQEFWNLKIMIYVINRILKYGDQQSYEKCF